MLGQPGRDLLHIFNYLTFEYQGHREGNDPWEEGEEVERKKTEWKRKKEKGKGRNEIGERRGRERRRKGKGKRKGETQKPWFLLQDWEESNFSQISGGGRAAPLVITYIPATSVEIDNKLALDLVDN